MYSDGLLIDYNLKGVIITDGIGVICFDGKLERKLIHPVLSPSGKIINIKLEPSDSVFARAEREMKYYSDKFDNIK